MLRDDGRHSVLSKARPVAQTMLSATAGGEAACVRPAASVGAARVLAVETRSALTVAGLPGAPWSLNPYMGCSHACAYCYVPDVAHVERPRWGSYVVVKRNVAAALARDLRRRERKPVFVSTATDPYQAAEKQHRLTRSCLELLARVDWPVRILSRSPLVLRDVDLLGRFSDVEVGVSVPTVDDAVRATLEPGAPPIAARLKALRGLADAGLTTFAFMIPAYPWTDDATPDAAARALAEAGVARVHVGPWRYLDDVLPAVRAQLPASVADAFVQAAADGVYFRRQERAMRVACARHGVAMAHHESGSRPRGAGPQEAKVAEAGLFERRRQSHL